VAKEKKVTKEKKTLTHEDRCAIARKAVETRRKRDPNWGAKSQEVKTKKKKSKKKESDDV